MSVWIVLCFMCFFLGFTLCYIKYGKETPKDTGNEVIKSVEDKATERMTKQYTNLFNYTGSERGQMNIDD